jgi:hypothetical protein
MTRFEYAVGLTQSPPQTLLMLAGSFYAAVNEATVEGCDPTSDPAILLMGTYISFQTHADVNTKNGYDRLIRLCHDRINEPPPELQ